MRIQSWCLCVVANPEAVWGRVTQPALVLTDMVGRQSAWSMEGEDRARLVVDPHLNCVRLREVCEPHAHDCAFHLVASGLKLTWRHSVTPTSLGTRTGVGNVWEYSSGGQSYLLWFEPCPNTEVESVLCERAQVVSSDQSRRWMSTDGSFQAMRFECRLEPASLSAPSKPTIKLVVGVWNESDDDEWNDEVETDWYALVISTGIEPTMLKARTTRATLESGGTVFWESIRTMATEDSQSEQNWMPYREEPQVVASLKSYTVWVAGDELLWFCEGRTDPLRCPLEVRTSVDTDEDSDGDPEPPRYELKSYTIRAVWVEWSNYEMFSCQVYPLLFESEGEVEYGDHVLGFVPTEDPTVRVRERGSRPSDTDVEVEFDENAREEARYTLRLTSTPASGSQYGSKTPLVQAVELEYEEQEESVIDFPLMLYPNEVQVSSQFDVGRLQVRSRAQLRLQDPDGSVARYWGARGHHAIQIEGYRTVSEIPSDDSILFTGYLNRQMSVGSDSAGLQTVQLLAEDRTCQLAQPRWWIAWMDGWNVYYAMAYLAALGGIRREQLGFQSLVPENPYDEVPSSEPAWFLPVGGAGTPLTRFSGVNLWDAMSRIASTIGYVLYFDHQGFLQFHKFRVPAGFDRIYREVTDHPDELIQTIQYHRDLSQVRNQITVVGLDAYAPMWLPTVSHRVDSQSLTNFNAPNYIGYPQPFVWADSQFARLEFARAAAETAFARMRHPYETVSFTTLFTPSLRVGMILLLECLRLDTVGKRYLVTQVSHRLWGERFGETQVQARWIPDE